MTERDFAFISYICNRKDAKYRMLNATTIKPLVDSFEEVMELLKLSVSGLSACHCRDNVKCVQCLFIKVMDEWGGKEQRHDGNR
jgi:hypothetical protein